MVDLLLRDIPDEAPHTGAGATLMARIQVRVLMGEGCHRKWHASPSVCDIMGTMARAPTFTCLHSAPHH